MDGPNATGYMSAPCRGPDVIRQVNKSFREERKRLLKQLEQVIQGTA